MTISFYSTNDKKERVSFKTALLKGMAQNYGLFMIPRNEIPKLSQEVILKMKNMSYAQIAYEVLSLFLSKEISPDKLKSLLEDAYNPEEIPTEVQHVTGKTHILWLTKGPTYSFKDYAARFFSRALNHFLGIEGIRRTVVVATSGDTGGAVADSLHGLG